MNQKALFVSGNIKKFPVKVNDKINAGYGPVWSKYY